MNSIRSQMQACRDGFICMICGKCLLRRKTLRQHLRDTHYSSEKEYQCPHCNKYMKAKTMIKERHYVRFALKK